jgi:hypothetical protein
MGSSCGSAKINETVAPSKSNLATVQPVNLIPLAGKVTLQSVEASGLAWYGDHLIILPQFPERFASAGDGLVFAISKESIIAFLDGKSDAAITPQEIPFVAQGIANRISGFQGFEAVAFQGSHAFLTIESQVGRSMLGYLASGEMADDLSVLTLNLGELRKLPSQSGSMNMTDEAVLVVDDKVVTIHEANGANVNPNPVAHLFGLSLQPWSTIPFPTLEYRVTDATSPDLGRRFWVINYFYPRDSSELKPAPDVLDSEYGFGNTYALTNGIERLVELQYSESGITLARTKPIYLEMNREYQSRNWEGLVRLENRGFLLITDKFPTTLLAFVPAPFE